MNLDSTQQTGPGDPDTREHSYWPTFPRLLPKHFGILVDIAERCGNDSESVRIFSDHSFLGMLGGASRKDIQIFYDYVTQLSVGKLMQAMSLLSSLARSPEGIECEKSRSFLAGAFAAIAQSRHEVVVSAVCAQLTATYPPTNISNAIKESAAHPSNVELRTIFDIPERGDTIQIARDAIGVFWDQKLRSIALIDPSGPRTSTWIAPHNLETILCFITVTLPEMIKMRQEFPHLDKRIHQELQRQDLIRVIDREVVGPLARRESCSRMEIFRRLWPHESISDLEKVAALLDSTPPRGASRKVATEDLRLNDYFQDSIIQSLHTDAWHWYTRRIPGLAGLISFSTFSDYRRMRDDCCVPDDDCVAPGTDSWPIPELGITLPLAPIAAALRTLVDEVKPAMQQVRAIVDPSSIQSIPSIVPFRGRLPADQCELLGYLPVLVSTIENKFGVSLSSLPFRAWAHLLVYLAPKDSVTWDRLEKVVAKHPSCASLILEGFFSRAESDAPTETVLRLGEELGSSEVGAILGTYCRLLTTLDTLDSQFEWNRTTRVRYMEDRLDWSRASQAALKSANRCLDRIAKRSLDRRSVEAADLTELDFYRTELVFAAALCRCDGPASKGKIQFQWAVVAPSELSEYFRKSMTIIAELGCMDYPEPLRSLTVREFDQFLATVTDGTFHVLTLDSELIAFMHTSSARVTALGTPFRDLAVYARSLYARTEAQKCGVGLELLRNVIDGYIAQGIALEATVWDKHPMQEYYTGTLRFVEFGEPHDLFPGSGYTFKRIVRR